jgi:PKD repeat protein
MKKFVLLLVLISLSCLALAEFTVVDSTMTGVYNGSAAWGDYDSDGDLDILLTGQAGLSSYVAKIYRNDGGTFTSINAGLPGVNFSAAAWGDYDRDGDLDILLIGYTGSAYISKIYRNDLGFFTDINAGLEGIYYGSVAWGDYDNDGDLDILMAGSDNGIYLSRIYRNDAGLFTDINAGLTAVYRSSVAWGDYDNDADLDILLTGYSGTEYISKIYRNDAGSFTDISAALVPVQYGSAAWGDYDNDGDLDIVLAGQSAATTYVAKVYRNDSGSFIDTSAPLLPVKYCSVAWGDFDNDGKLDILLSGNGLDSPYYYTHMYYNYNGSFTEVGGGLFGVQRSSVAWGDYDNDLDLDFLVTGTNLTTASARLYSPNFGSSNGAPNPPDGLTATNEAGFVRFAWENASDSSTPLTGLNYNLRIGTTSGGSEITTAMAAANGFRKIAARGYVNSNQDWKISSSLLGNQNEYYWSVQSVDGSFIGSAFAAEQIYHPILVTAPNGGEAFLTETEQTINWEANLALQLNFYLSTDNGSSWTALNTTPVEAALGSFNFTTPDFESNLCLIKVENAANGTVFDVSDAPFSVSFPPHVELTGPLPGKLQTGRNYDLTWIAINVPFVNLEYSINGGTDWTGIAESVAADPALYNWTVPNSPSDSCLFRISSTSNPAVNAISAAFYTFSALELTGPNGGEVFQTGSSQTISWTAAEITTLQLEYSLDNGLSWNLISSTISGSDISYAWTVPETSSAEYLIRISDADYASIYDVSDTVFTAAALTLVQPSAAGLKLKNGWSYDITWSSANLSGTLALEISYDNGQTWNFITSGIDLAPGLLNVTVNDPPTLECRLRITSDQHPLISSMSANPFTICNLELTSPSGNEIWGWHSNHAITWTQDYINFVYLEYSTDSGLNWSLIEDSLAASLGTYDWVIPSDLTTECLVRVTDAEYPSIYDNSNAFITLRPQLQLTYPNGGESIEVTTQLGITWITTADVDSVLLDYSTDNGLTWLPVTEIPVPAGNEFFNWEVPQIPTTDCLIRIRDAEDQAIYDLSDAFFTIYPQITVTVPNGGEVIEANVIYQIRWMQTTNVLSVLLDYSIDSGATWLPIVTEPYSAAENIYNWLTPNNPSEACLVRVTNSNYAYSFDVSNLVFTLKPQIFPPLADFTADNTLGWEPMTVQFTDLSQAVSGTLTSWLWDFGDGQFSSQQNPLHVYPDANYYTVSLTVTNSYDSVATVIKTDYIQVQTSYPVFRYMTGSPINFGFVYVDQQSALQHIYIRNVGQAAFSLDSLSFGLSPSPFALEGNFQSVVLQPGAITYISVKFMPLAPGSFSDSLFIYNGSVNLPRAGIKLIGTSGWAQPQPPENVLITIQNNDALVEWDAVTQTIYGTPITPDYYLIFYCGLPYPEGPYYYLGWSESLSYVHSRVALHAQHMFYQVVAYKSDSSLRTQNLLARLREGMTADEVGKILNSR